MRQVSPVDAAWLALESRDTPMHVGGLFEFTLPADAPPDYLKQEFERMREARDYNEAMRRFFSHKPFNFESVGGRPTREEIHDRARAREDLVREELAREETK